MSNPNSSLGRRVLVTGGAGFIGANLVRMLLQQGCRVTVLDDLSNGQRSYLDGLELELVEADIRDFERIVRLLGTHDWVVHLAAQASVPRSLDEPLTDFEINVRGTLLLLEAARQVGIERFVFASSNAPLGRQKPPAREDQAPLPISPYGASKLAGEAYSLAYQGSWGLRTTILRFGNVYGPFSGHQESVVASFFKRILAGEGVTIYDTGAQTRDFIFVGDLCRAIVLALNGPFEGELFQIATGMETSISELAGLVGEVVSADLEKPFEVGHAAPRPGDIDKNFSDVGKAREILGWTPEIPLIEGLRRTWRWFQEDRNRHGSVT